MKNNAAAIVAGALKKARSIFIAGHARPDGDTAGASLALMSALRRLGKKVGVYSKEPLPPYLEFLPGADKIKIGKPQAGAKFDAALILECSDLGRMGGLISSESARVYINIDHHLVSSPFGDINYIDPSAPATCFQILKIFGKMGIAPTAAEAECLYTGLLTDTGKFTQKNTTPETLDAAATLMRAGADIEKINDNVFGNRPAGALKLLSAALASIRLYNGGKLAILILRRRDFEMTRTEQRDTEGFINFPMTISGVRVAAFIRETSGEYVKISMRSNRDTDITPLAASFGGGGHKHAAGFSLRGGISDGIAAVKRGFSRLSV